MKILSRIVVTREIVLSLFLRDLPEFFFPLFNAKAEFKCF